MVDLVDKRADQGEKLALIENANTLLPKAGVPIIIPNGSSVGAFVKEKLGELGLLSQSLDVRVFHRSQVSRMLHAGTDSNDGETYCWPYVPDKWEYHTVIAESSSGHPGGFAFYRRDGLQVVYSGPKYERGERGIRKFTMSPQDALVAVFRYEE
jgi:hypothetical protein